MELTLNGLYEQEDSLMKLLLKNANTPASSDDDKDIDGFRNLCYAFKDIIGDNSSVTFNDFVSLNDMKVLFSKKNYNDVFFGCYKLRPIYERNADVIAEKLLCEKFILLQTRELLEILICIEDKSQDYYERLGEVLAKIGRICYLSSLFENKNFPISSTAKCISLIGEVKDTIFNLPERMKNDDAIAEALKKKAEETGDFFITESAWEASEYSEQEMLDIVDTPRHIDDSWPSNSSVYLHSAKLAIAKNRHATEDVLIHILKTECGRVIEQYLAVVKKDYQKLFSMLAEKHNSAADELLCVNPFVSSETKDSILGHYSSSELQLKRMKKAIDIAKSKEAKN
jgi:hypothetical protein